MTDREQWEDLGCGDGACVFRTPTGMHTNGGCRCLPRKADYNAVERSRLRRLVSVMRDRIVEQERELAEARRRVARLESERDELAHRCLALTHVEQAAVKLMLDPPGVSCMSESACRRWGDLSDALKASGGLCDD